MNSISGITIERNSKNGTPEVAHIDLNRYGLQLRSFFSINGIIIDTMPDNGDTLFTWSNIDMAYSPETIIINDKTYNLKFPLRCSFRKEEDYYVIKNEQLDIVATGQTPEDAETDFKEEFDYLYSRLNELNDNQLSNRMLAIKNTINQYVKSIQ
jgi:predicted RNase H-like HicB family nuclease